MNVTVSKNKRYRGSKSEIIFTVAGLFFAFIGMKAVVSEWGKLQETTEMQEWKQTDCTIVSSKMNDKGKDFRLDLSYRYTVDGKIFTSSRYGKKPSFTAKKIRAFDATQKKLLKGKTVSCFYNPANPAESVIKRPSRKEAIGSILLALLVPLFGLFFAVLPWLAGRKKKKEKEEAEKTEKKKRFGSKYIFLVLGLIFGCAGLAIFIFTFLLPQQKIEASKSWLQIKAKVISSKVISSTNKNGTSYRPYIAYRYKIGGEEYLGDNYSFNPGSSSGSSEANKIIRTYSKGHSFPLYVNPNNPTESVIRRDLAPNKFLLILPIGFMLAGILLLTSMFHQKKFQLDPEQARHHTILLKGPSPLGKAIKIVLFTLVWNGAVYFFIQSNERLFSIIFGFVALILIAASIYAILALFNPRPTAEISPGNIHPNTEISLRWRINGRINRIGKLTISLKCLRVTTVSTNSGTNHKRRVVKTPIYEEEIFITDQQNQIAQDQLQFTIPEDKPASILGEDGGIQWQLLFHGDISRWPDLKQEFPFFVYPK